MNPLYERFPWLLMARRNVARTPVRSALAALGIVIGVLAIASLGVFGTTLQYSVTQNLGDVGNDVTVSPAADTGERYLSDRDVRDIERAVTTETVVPVKQDRGVVTYGRQRTAVALYGIERPGRLFEARDGRIPSPLRSGVLVGSTLADSLDVHAGNSLSVDGKTYRVKAVLESQGGITALNPGGGLVVPPSAVDHAGYDQVVVRAESAATANASAQNIRERLNDRQERVSVFEYASLTSQISNVFGVVNTFLIGVGSISLVVAGVSILNVMLMSAVERRQEIGVLRAVGYQKRDVLIIMLAEAVLLGIVGGGVGVLLSMAAGLVINQVVLGDPLFTFSAANLGYFGAAFAFAFVTSLLSGLYPAWKAANRNPVEALRS
ncbi:ABC transporter substrate-binding protein [Halarchaeum grantii]|uniref:ABC transporter substrate-binding protein n=1 Tax=Halarchaeum grantii TaxID=1193105 RepID=A0A830F1J5_9EURY|nr:ABC transporter permease [Halarchaeum grantii]GGL30362.1 ABC transporter substrate-binding protein [Halarchaeum grantii]